MGQRPLVMWSAVCSAPQSQLSFVDNVSVCDEAMCCDSNGFWEEAMVLCICIATVEHVTSK